MRRAGGEPCVHFRLRPGGRRGAWGKSREPGPRFSQALQSGHGHSHYLLGRARDSPDCLNSRSERSCKGPARGRLVGSSPAGKSWRSRSAAGRRKGPREGQGSPKRSPELTKKKKSQKWSCYPNGFIFGSGWCRSFLLGGLPLT